jgi:hypothetical protein
MRITAICKTFRGHEFVVPMIRSIYDHVGQILFVHSDLGWDGETGNTVKPVVSDWCHRNDKASKVVSVDFDSKDQTQQYLFASEYANEEFKPDIHMYIDTDEVWDVAQLTKAIALIEQNPGHSAYTVNMWSHLKSPFFVIRPMDACQPVSFVRSDAQHEGYRGASIADKHHLDVHFHHFSGVRESLGLVLEKYQRSSGLESEPLRDLNEWITDVWNGLPGSENLHPNSGFASTWKNVEVVDWDSLPEACQGVEFIEAFRGYRWSTNVIDIPKDNKYNLPTDFGPSHPDWKVPSKQAKYKLLIKELREGTQLPKPTPQQAQKQVPVQHNAVEKLPPSKRNAMYNDISYTGKTIVYTICSGKYQWYAPLFVHSLKTEYPEYDVAVYLLGNCELPEDLMESVYPIKLKDFQVTPYNTATLRFCWTPPCASEYDYFLISDVDMLHYREEPDLVNQRMRDLNMFGLDCYSNFVSSIDCGEPRMPGIHFVTKEWWGKTMIPRVRYLREITKHPVDSWSFDERMIHKIVAESGLRIQDQEKRLWMNHGTHLGDARRQLQDNRPVQLKNAFKAQHIKKLLSDERFLRLLELTYEHLPTNEIFSAYRKII